MDREDRSQLARLANLVLSTLADLFAWDRFFISSDQSAG
jgi:hypothetical protein